jgi:hypothetical protein
MRAWPPLLCPRDHSLDFTADNTYAGLAGTYFVRNCNSDMERIYMPNIK